jgi:hypothetical protein
LVSEHNETTFDQVFRLGGQRIFEETNGLVDDNHFGESAHRIMADLFFTDIVKNI